MFGNVSNRNRRFEEAAKSFCLNGFESHAIWHSRGKLIWQHSHGRAPLRGVLDYVLAGYWHLRMRPVHTEHRRRFPVRNRPSVKSSTRLSQIFYPFFLCLSSTSLLPVSAATGRLLSAPCSTTAPEEIYAQCRVSTQQHRHGILSYIGSLCFKRIIPQRDQRSSDGVKTMLLSTLFLLFDPPPSLPSTSSFWLLQATTLTALRRTPPPGLSHCNPRMLSVASIFPYYLREL